MTQAIRFYSIDPRTGAEDTEYGHAWKTDDGLEYENDIIRDIMANTVRRFGVETAFRRFSDWGNGYSCSHLVEPGDPSYVEIAAMAEEDDEAERAAGHDTTPGNDELHHYWTRGEGLAKWAESPKPWTTLVAHLTRHVGERKAKIFASRWFIEVFGYAAGSDKNRVAHGHPPRGHVVGPG